MSGGEWRRGGAAGGVVAPGRREDGGIETKSHCNLPNAMLPALNILIFRGIPYMNGFRTVKQGPASRPLAGSAAA